MTLLHPMALAWAALAVPIAALYILRIRRRRQVVPTVMFWDQVFQDTRPRSLWRQLRHWVSLLMQLGFAGLLVAALTEPILSGASRKPVHYILVFDQSASMQATDGQPTRFEEAKSKAHALIRSMRDLDQCTVIGAAVQPAIACGRTYHQRTLHAAIDALECTDAPANLEDALSLAESVDVGDQERAVVLFSDAGGVRGLAGEHRESVSIHTCGSGADNLAITGFAVRPRSDNPVELHGMLKVANYGRQEAEAEVRLKLDDRLHDLVVMKLAPGEEKLRSFSLINKGDGLCTAELVGSDALAVDNRAVAVLPRMHESNVTLVTTGNLFLESVIRSHPWMKLTTVEPDKSDGAVKAADIVVYDRHVPGELPHKPALYIYPASDSRLWKTHGELKSPLVSDTDKDSELLRHVSFQNVTFHLARAITPVASAQTVMSSFENALLLRWAAASPPVILLAVDINQSDLPWRTAFPILMQNALNDLAGQKGDQPSAYRTGQTADSLEGIGQGPAHDGRGRPVALTVCHGRLKVGPVASAGVVTVENAKSKEMLAFNLANAAESNLRKDEAVSTQPATGQTDRAMTAAYALPWWVWLTLVALALSTVEWCLHQRRVVD